MKISELPEFEASDIGDLDNQPYLLLNTPHDDAYSTGKVVAYSFLSHYLGIFDTEREYPALDTYISEHGGMGELTGYYGEDDPQFDFVVLNSDGELQKYLCDSFLQHSADLIVHSGVRSLESISELEETDGYAFYLYYDDDADRDHRMSVNDFVAQYCNNNIPEYIDGLAHIEDHNPWGTKLVIFENATDGSIFEQHVSSFTHICMQHYLTDILGNADYYTDATYLLAFNPDGAGGVDTVFPITLGDLYDWIKDHD